MTIEQLAAQMKVTRQAIVNKMRRAGISFTELSKGKQGKAWILTDEGAARIRELMKRNAAQSVTNAEDNNLEEQRTRLEEQQRTIEEQRTRNEEQQRTIEEQRTRLEEQQRTIEEQRTRNEEQQRTIEEQRTRLEEQQRTIEEQHTRLEQLDKTIQAQAIMAATQAATIQSMHNASMQRIAAPAEKKPGMWARIAARIGGKKGKAEGQGGS